MPPRQRIHAPPLHVMKDGEVAAEREKHDDGDYQSPNPPHVHAHPLAKFSCLVVTVLVFLVYFTSMAKDMSAHDAGELVVTGTDQMMQFSSCPHISLSLSLSRPSLS